ncbi:MAG TPA: Holliday junction resolvase RuvX [Patescibacteria group bacterium]|nr:Holliday junction resolvase RuvX [Patescibacteria group bacterium]
MAILGIDYGRKRIGIALSEGTFSSPLKVLTVSSIKGTYLQIENLCKELTVTKIVIGLPEGAMGEEIKRFGRKLYEALRIPVVFYDETLTSKDALQGMIASGKKKKSRRVDIDAYAASLILQSYLDEQDTPSD